LVTIRSVSGRVKERPARAAAPARAWRGEVHSPGMPLAPGSRLGHYQIVAPVGKGGMGEVYRARDSTLDREVAIKVLPESLAGNKDALARFQVEARALAALSHPNILGIFDLGSEDGVSYVVMELLQGETLRDKVKEGAPLPQRKALDYTREIARGLSAAHEKGIVHRDLKPENVFITRDERVKILDFGLAKRVAPADEAATHAPTQSNATEPGTVMGTVGYMAPEQVRGLAVDHRADLFALGAILYELLTGKRAFKGLTSSDTMLSVLRDEPAELSQTPSSIPPALTRILRHCLEKSPEARAHSAHDIAFQLDTVSSFSGTMSTPSSDPTAAPPQADRRSMAPLLSVAAIAIVAVTVAAIALWRRPAAPPAEGPAAAPGSSASAARAGVKRLAVLPFENLGSADDDYFADGITDEVRGKLTNVPGLGVIARTSSVGYRKTAKSPREIGKELDVEYLLTGTVRFAKADTGARRVQVSPELVVASNAESRWRQPFDATLTDVFQVQGEIATKVAQALDVALSEGSKKKLEAKPTENLPAYEAYLRGQESSQAMSAIDPPSLRRALDAYAKAVALDARFVEAWAELSRAASNLYVHSAPTPQLAEQTRQAAEKALSLAPERPEGHRAQGDYLRNVLKDSTRALSAFEKAQAAAPGDASYVASVALAEQGLGRWEASIAHLQEARRLDPRSPTTLRRLGTAAAFLRRPTEAREAFDAVLGIVPTNLPALEFRAMTYLQQGDLAGARASLKTAPKEMTPAAIVAFLAAYNDLGWVLDDAQRELLLGLTPGSFDDDRGTWALSLTQAYALRRDAPNVKKYADLALRSFTEQLSAAPEDAQLHALAGLSQGYLGRKAEAIREATRAVELLPLSQDAFYGPYMQHQLVRVFILTGEHQKALDTLEALLSTPYYLSKGWLSIDPNFDALRSEPRFAKLIAR